MTQMLFCEGFNPSEMVVETGMRCLMKAKSLAHTGYRSVVVIVIVLKKKKMTPLQWQKQEEEEEKRGKCFHEKI